MRLIDADELYRIEKLLDTSMLRQNTAAFVLLDQVLYDIQNVPEVDAVPVVRCKDCTYFSNAKINTKGFLICPASGMEITEDDYCSYGERKEANT